MKVKDLPDGWEFRGFRFALDARPSEVMLLARHAGMRRKAYNWAVAIFKRNSNDYRVWLKAFKAGDTIELPPVDELSAFGLRKRWNAEKSRLCVDDNGAEWWTELSKEAAASGIADAVDAYWRWAKSQNETGARKFGFPRFKRKGRSVDTYRISTGVYGPDGNRHVKIPRIGRVRTGENMRTLTRLLNSGDATLGAMTLVREGKRWFCVMQAAVRPPTRWNYPAEPARTIDDAKPLSVVGVDVGVNCLAVVAAGDGTILERIDNPEPLAAALAKLRVLQRAQQRSRNNNHQHTRRYHDRRTQISELHARIARLRKQLWHDLTTRLAKTHDRIVIEDLAIAAMTQQKGTPGARKRRRRLADAAIGTMGRQLAYKCERYNCELIRADRWYPSTKTCHRCGTKNDVGWARRWVCDSCNAHHDRDENAAINLAKYTHGPHSWRGQMTPAASADGDTERLRDIKTAQRPQHIAATPAAVPLMREDKTLIRSAVNPRGY